jgi:hypothetical protein
MPFKKFIKYLPESEIESGGPDEDDYDCGEEDPKTDTDFDEDDRQDHDFPMRDHD